MQKTFLLKTAVLAAAMSLTTPMWAQNAVNATTEGTVNLSDYGVEVTLVNDDFSKMQSGSETAPDFNTDITGTATGTPAYFHNLNQAYTSAPGWGAAYAYQAGGALCLYSSDSDITAHVNTPLFDASARGGMFIIHFRARLMQATPNYSGVGVHVIDFSKDPGNGSYLKMLTVPGITTDWQDFQLIVYGGTSSMLVNFVEEHAVRVLIDDIRISQLDQYVSTPEVLHARNYTGTSFRPNWRKVEGATQYFVNVYKSDDNTNAGERVVTDLATSDTICTVRGLVPGQSYRYTVAASDGTHRSLPTDIIDLSDLPIPMMADVTDFSGNTYTASWDNIGAAKCYNYYVYTDTVAPTDGAFDVINEDFDNVTDYGGGKQSWTPGNEPDDPKTQRSGFPAGTAMNGWLATFWAPLTDGCIALDGWNYFYDVKGNVYDPNIDADIKYYAKLESPALDLSKDNGNAHLSVSLYGQIAADNQDKANNYPEYQANAVVALLNYDYATGLYTEADRTMVNLQPKWATYDIDFTNGSENSKVVIYATDAPGFIYVDNLHLTQNYKAGETLIYPTIAKPGLTSNSVTVELPADFASHNYYHSVQAVGERQVYWATRTYTFYSEMSEMQPVHTATAIEAPSYGGTAKLKAHAVEGGIEVAAADGTQVNLYTADGTLAARATVRGGKATLAANAHGVYVVKAGTQSVKVAK